MRSVDLAILPQPDDVTCGPTCLHAVYRYYEDDIALEEVIRDVVAGESRGSLGVCLGVHALRRGYRALLYTFNLDVFDPTWFDERAGDAREDLPERLKRQVELKGGERLRRASEHYIEFLERGGCIRFRELTPKLLREPLLLGQPILAGLSATYLYGCARERDDGSHLHYDDLAGVPTGHFVVAHGYDPERDRVRIADPLHQNPRFGGPRYEVSLSRLLGAILLGVLTYDGNLLILEPGAAPSPVGGSSVGGSP